MKSAIRCRSPWSSLGSSLGPTLAVTCLLGCGSEPSGTRAAPSVILISIDSLRADHLSAYGYSRETSPFMDQLAAEGALFRNAVSSTSWTLPSHASMFTGLPDSVHGCDHSSRVLAPDRRTIAEAFQGAGYRTAAFWSGPFLHPRFGLAQGFDEYVNCSSYQAFGRDSIEDHVLGEKPKGLNEAHGRAHDDITGPRVVQELQEWLTSRDETPFFLFIHLWDVHYDYIPPAPYDTLFDPGYTGAVDGRGLSTARLEAMPRRDREHVVALYDGEVRWTDLHVQKVVELVARQIEAQDTILMVTSDHGEEFLEHGNFGHHKALFGESIRIPVILHAPGRVPPGTEVDGLIRMMDLGPTLLDLAGVEALPDTGGQSIMPLIFGGATRSDRLAVSELQSDRYGSLLAIRSEAWKLIVDTGTGAEVGLWSIASDPTEQDNLLQSDAGLTTEALEALERISTWLEELKRMHGDGLQEGTEMPPELVEQLRALGYLE